MKISECVKKVKISYSGWGGLRVADDLSYCVPENRRKPCNHSSSKMRQGIHLDPRATVPNDSEGGPKN